MVRNSRDTKMLQPVFSKCSAFIEFHASSWNFMKVQGTACKLRELHASLCNCMQAHWPACKLMDLNVSSWTCRQAHGFAIYMHASSWICNLHACKLMDLHSFWNILDNSGSFWIILKHSRTFWIILDVVEGCSKVDFQVDQTQTHKQTDIRTCWAASLQLKTILDICFHTWAESVHWINMSTPRLNKFRNDPDRVGLSIKV